MNRGFKTMAGIRRAGLACVLATLCTPLAPVMAQSVGDFRLQPKETPTTQAQGPVDRDAPVVRPATPTPSPTPAQPVATPSPAATATSAPAASTPSPTPSTRPSPAAQPRSNAPAASAPNALAVDAPASVDRPAVVASTEAQAPVVVATFEPSPSAGKALPFDLWWLAIPAALIVLAGLWFMLRGKRGEAADDEDYAEAPAEAPPVLAETPPIAKRPPQPKPAAPTPAPAPIPAPAQWSGDTLAISLDVGRMSATLVNASLSWRLIVENRGDTPLGPVMVAGDMIAAHASMPVEQQLATDGQPLELIDDIGVIAPGGQAELRGEFRVPLSSIQPIQAGSALLYIPLARFRVEADEVTTLATFAIGETPPVAKAALLPFRLDLGPRVWAKISQRQVDRQPVAA